MVPMGGFTLSKWSKILRKRGGHRCGGTMSPREHSYPANDWSILCASSRLDRPRPPRIHSLILPSFAVQTVVFLYLFQL